MSAASMTAPGACCASAPASASASTCWSICCPSSPAATRTSGSRSTSPAPRPTWSATASTSPSAWARCRTAASSPRRLGVLHRYLCAAPDYLARRGTPAAIEDLRDHDLIEFPIAKGRRPNWVFSKDGRTVEHRPSCLISVNCALTIHKLIVNGAGIGVSSGFLCGPEFRAGRLVRLFEDWSLPSVDVHAVFPSQRELSPTVRAFIDFMGENSRTGHDPLTEGQGFHPWTPLRASP